MKEGWVEVEVSDLGRVQTGTTPPKKNPEYFGNDTIFIKPSDISEDRKYTYATEDNYSELGRTKFPKNLVPKGSTCVVTIGSIGKKITKAHCDCFINQQLNAVIPSKDFDEEFVYYVLRNNLPQLKSLETGSASGRENVSKSSFSSMRLFVPMDRAIQIRIGSILSAYDDLIENNLQRIKLLEEPAQRTYEEWFVKFRVNGVDLEMDAGTGLPVGWEEKEFQYFGDIVTGKTPSTSNSDFFSGDVPFVKTPDMSGFPYVLETSQTLSTSGANTQFKKFVPKNSLMVSCIGSAGVYALASMDCQTNQQINSIVFYQEHYAFYFYCFAKKLKPILEGLGSNGATMTNVNKGKFEKMTAVKPTDEALVLFHQLVKENFEVILNLQQQNRLLKESRDILLPRLMSGEVEV
jgi:type I restriction enzyme S subunit